MTEGSGRCAAIPVVLDEDTRGALQRIASSAKAQVRQVLRAQIVLAAADGAGNAAIARRLAVGVNTVRKWRGRFAEHGLEGLKDAARSGRPRRYHDLVRVAVVAAATSIPPGPAATWPTRPSPPRLRVPSPPRYRPPRSAGSWPTWT
ncbi:helix-turn-helix domain-containing protein [Streptomyces sp. NPDC052101]|uniref:helix-turn-helix domain-containing protein n=1 Tax=Streptomyces sp. NPDC052101 TaxID=3155763 RepID=UPI00341BAB79